MCWRMPEAEAARSRVWGQLGSCCLCPPSPKCWDDRPVAVSVCLVWVLGIPVKDPMLVQVLLHSEPSPHPYFSGVLFWFWDRFHYSPGCLEFLDAFLPRPTQCQDWRSELPPSLMLFLNLPIKRESPLKDFPRFPNRLNVCESFQLKDLNLQGSWR